MKTQISNYLMLIGVLVGFSSCEDETLFDISDHESALGDYYLEYTTAFSSTYLLVDAASRASVPIAGTTDTADFQGARLYYDSEGLLNIDFGNGVIGGDGIKRTGKIQVMQTGNYFEKDGSLAVGFDEYMREDLSVDGTFDVTNTGNDSLSVQLSGFKLKDEFTLNANQSIQWTSGFHTLENDTDDAYTFYGTSGGTDSKENSIDASIDPEQPLRFSKACEFGFISGIINMDFAVQPDSTGTEPTMTLGALDFIESDGCQNVARISIEKESGAITLTRQFNGK